MILYFTGTGNSEYAANRIGRIIGDDVLNLFEKIRAHDYSAISSSMPWVIAAPTYAWRIPRILQAWLEKTELAGSKDIYFLMTCGGDVGNADKYLKGLAEGKGMNYMGCYPIVMPENYTALYMPPSAEQAISIIAAADNSLDKAAEYIAKGARFPHTAPTTGDRLKSGIVNMLFYPFVVHAKKFYSTDACISCAKCAAVCPLNNIDIVNGRPKWKDNCTHCMACINRCPYEAIEYGAHSRGLARYICQKQKN